METPIWVLCIGFLAQAFFSARILTQWILSERARTVLSPSIFWVFSIGGSYLLCLYGWLRQDFSIVLGQFVAYYIYLWNLKAKGLWDRLPRWLCLLLMATPIAAILFVCGHAAEFVSGFLQNDAVPLWLILFGSFGQLLFTCRFIYQWWYSHRHGASLLPAGFWWQSLIGSLSIVIYGIIRHDPVLILGQSFGLVAYVRNLMIGHKRGGIS
jgi:lipid-A-disaccharide synthase-like uncharacterized protein